MSFLPLLYGKRKVPEVYTPWQNEYFNARVIKYQKLLGIESQYEYKGYGIIEKLKGGMADVLICKDVSNSMFALKTLKPDMVFDAKSNDMLADEAAKLIGMSAFFHLPPEDIIFDYDKNTCVIVFPYCAGGSLADRALFGPIQYDELIFYAMSVCAELLELEKNNILHLDLKPSNILFEQGKDDNPFWKWRTVVSDFGISKYKKKGEDIFNDSGTLAFMAPEQIFGLPLDTVTDIWGYGATFYNLICGRFPLEEVWPITSNNFETTKLIPLKTIDNNCPQWFSDIIMSCLTLSKNKRINSFSSILDVFCNNVLIITTDQDIKNAFAGTTQDNASNIFCDSYLLGYANKFGKAKNFAHMTITTGWLKDYNDAHRLFKTHRSGATQKALIKLNLVLGDWDCDGSLLHQFKNDPFANHYTFNRDKIPKNNESFKVAEIDAPVPLTYIWQMLDLKCMCLVTLVETLARKNDINEFLSTVNIWLKTKSFGFPYEEWILQNKKGPPQEICVCRMSQGLRLAGEYDRAINLLKLADLSWPDNIVILNTLLHSYGDAGYYKDAFKIADRLLDLAYSRDKNMNDYIRTVLIKGYIAFRSGNIELAIAIYNQIINDYDYKSQQVCALLQQAIARRDLCSDLNALNGIVNNIDHEDRLETKIAIAEIAYWAKQYETAKCYLSEILNDPTIYLPTRNDQLDLVINLLEKC